MLDGAMAGGSGGHNRDGYDLFSFMVAKQSIIEAIDVELLEQRYPILVTGKRPRVGSAGAGMHRAGAGCEMRYRPHGTTGWVGVMLGMRERVPLPGFAGGYPGATTRFWIQRGDAEREPVPGHMTGLVVSRDDEFSFALGSGGGYGDPADRDPVLVARDVAHGRIDREEASAIYGVIVGAGGEVSTAETQIRRKELFKTRLASAVPAERPSAQIASTDRPGLPLYIGVEQRGDLAVASESGAVLGRAPRPWTDGCPVLVEPLGDHAEVRSYLDPLSGRALLVDVVPRGMAQAITSQPRRWMEAGKVAIAAE
jgi:N-methylhydantoinase B